MMQSHYFASWQLLTMGHGYDGLCNRWQYSGVLITGELDVQYGVTTCVSI
jgi:hypothetical protein